MIIGMRSAFLVLRCSAPAVHHPKMPRYYDTNEGKKRQRPNAATDSQHRREHEKTGQHHPRHREISVIFVIMHGSNGNVGLCVLLKLPNFSGDHVIINRHARIIVHIAHHAFFINQHIGVAGKRPEVH